MSGIAEALLSTLKIMAIIAVSATFLLAVNTLLGFVTSWASTTVLGEIFNLISMYLPFNSGAVFGLILTACTAILSFKVAKKIFDLTSWGISAV